MKITFYLCLRLLIAVTLPFMVDSGFAAAPLTWFPGPSTISPMSGAATVVYPGLGNVLIAGDGSYPYPEYLTATNPYWSPVPMPLNSVTIAPGAVASGGMIILYGGTDGASSQSAVIGYSTSDPATSLASMSVARAYFGYAPDASGNAYAIGGLDGSGNSLASTERYNPDADAWSPVAPLPAARYNFPAVFDHVNRIYIFGGRTHTLSGNETATGYYYSTKSNRWAAIAPMPIATAGSAAALGVDGKIYVVGGVSGGITTNVVQVYDPGANAWALAMPLPEALSAASLGVDSQGRLVVMGGMDANGNDVADVWRSQAFGMPDSAPVFTQFPSNLAVYQQPYASAINASGNPPPTYQLLSGPATMAVDFYSGAITWTPGDADIRTNAVTIQAGNYNGSTNWTFAIIVPHPPPEPVTNLAVVSVTEDSVTLSWSPENPVVGPVTYSAWLQHSVHDPKGSGATVWYTPIGGATTGTNLTIGGLAAGLTQDYYIVATAPGGTSGYTSAIGATTLPSPAPTNLRVTGLTSTTISLDWDAPVGPVPVVSYEILGVFDGVFVQYPLGFQNILGTNVTLNSLTPGNALLWGVSALDAYGNVSSYDYLPSLVINPPPSPASLTVPATSAATGGFQFTVQAGAVRTTWIQATTNLADPMAWVTIATNLPASSTFNFTDPNAGQFRVRFYRVASP